MGVNAKSTAISAGLKILSEKHDIKLVHVKLTDTAAVSRILAEKGGAGRSSGGSIDLFLWVNGENFAAMKGWVVTRQALGNVITQLALY